MSLMSETEMRDVEDELVRESDARAAAEAELAEIREAARGVLARHDQMQERIRDLETDIAWREGQDLAEPAIHDAVSATAYALGRSHGETDLYRVLDALRRRLADPDRTDLRHALPSEQYHEALSRGVTVVLGLRLAARHAATAQEAALYGQLAAQMGARIQRAYTGAL